MPPLVSVILPTYNWKDEWISKSIESVLNQTFKDFELIIINDFSTNDVEKVIKRFQKKDSRIVYLTNEENLKITKTLNRWLGVANWKYIARIDDDDIWNDNTKLEKQVNFMESYKDYWLCWAWKIIEINELW
jgi:glycosyltransferase involved in cell wall biosynthesis